MNFFRKPNTPIKITKTFASLTILFLLAACGGSSGHVTPAPKNADHLDMANITDVEYVQRGDRQEKIAWSAAAKGKFHYTSTYKSCVTNEDVNFEKTYETDDSSLIEILTTDLIAEHKKDKISDSTDRFITISFKDGSRFDINLDVMSLSTGDIAHDLSQFLYSVVEKDHLALYKTADHEEAQCSEAVKEQTKTGAYSSCTETGQSHSLKTRFVIYSDESVAWAKTIYDDSKCQGNIIEKRDSKFWQPIRKQSYMIKGLTDSSQEWVFEDPRPAVSEQYIQINVVAGLKKAYIHYSYRYGSPAVPTPIKTSFSLLDNAVELYLEP